MTLDTACETGYRAACSQAALFDLSHRQRISIVGKEAVAFLHNLASNDVKGLARDDGCEVFLTTLKAHTLSHGFVTRGLQDGADWLMLDVEPAAFSHLDRHLISEQLELTNLSPASAQFHLCGPRAEEVLARTLGRPVPPAAELQSTWDIGDALPSAHIRKHAWLGLPGYDLFLVQFCAAEVRAKLLAAGATGARPEDWNVLRIEAGWPEWGKELDENRFVVETGRIAQAISYTKGCYLGQEPIVMARDRGHVNRQLLGLKFAALGAVATGLAGARVLLGEQEIGQVTSATASPRLATDIALAYLRRGHWTSGLAVEVETPEGRLSAAVAVLPFVPAVVAGV